MASTLRPPRSLSVMSVLLARPQDAAESDGRKPLSASAEGRVGTGSDPPGNAPRPPDAAPGVTPLVLTLYSSSFCGACAQTRLTLEDAAGLLGGRVVLREVNVALDPDDGAHGSGRPRAGARSGRPERSAGAHPHRPPPAGGVSGVGQWSRNQVSSAPARDSSRPSAPSVEPNQAGAEGASAVDRPR